MSSLILVSHMLNLLGRGKENAHVINSNITSNTCIKNVLIDLLLSKTVSLPTSSRPICFGSTLYFSRREVTAVKLKSQSRSESKPLLNLTNMLQQNEKRILQLKNQELLPVLIQGFLIIHNFLKILPQPLYF